MARPFPSLLRRQEPGGAAAVRLEACPSLAVGVLLPVLCLLIAGAAPTVAAAEPREQALPAKVQVDWSAAELVRRENVKSALWVANARATYGKGASYAPIMNASVLGGTFALFPDMDPSLAAREVQKWYTETKTRFCAGSAVCTPSTLWTTKQGRDFLIESASTAIDLIELKVKNPKYKLGLKILKGAIKVIPKAHAWATSGEPTATRDKIVGRPDAVAGPREQWEAERWSEIYATAKRDQKLAKAIDLLYGDEMDARVNDTIDQFLAKNPEFKDVLDALGASGESSSVNVQLAKLLILTRAELGDLNKVLERDRQVLDRLVDQQDELAKGMNSLLAWKEQQEERAREAEMEERRARIEQAQIDGAKSAIYLLSTLAGFVNPEAGKHISVIGNASIQIVEAVRQFTATVAKLPDLTAMSSVVLTGNIVGAVMSVVSLIGGGSSPEDQLLAQIGLLRQEVSQLRTEMHTRFDEVDRKLHDLQGQIAQGFGAINVQTGRLQGDVSVIMRGLVDAQRQIVDLERSLMRAIGDSTRQRLWEDINLALGYDRTTGQAMPYESFIRLANNFHTWGVTTATTAAFSVGESGRSTSPDQLLTELTRYDLDTNLNYLLQLAGARSPAQGNVANPSDWSAAARAFAQLMMEQPQHAVRYSRDPLRELLATGTELRAALRSLATNRAAFDAALDIYLSGSEELRAHLAFRDDEIRAQKRLATPWAGVTDALRTDLVPGLGTLMPCSPKVTWWETITQGGNTFLGTRDETSPEVQLNAPDALGALSAWFPPEFLLVNTTYGAEFGGAELRVCYTADYQNLVSSTGGACTANDCWGTIALHIFPQFRWRREDSWSSIAQIDRIYDRMNVATWPLRYTPFPVLIDRWRRLGYRDAFQAGATPSRPLASELRANVGQVAASRVSEARREYYGRLLADVDGILKPAVDRMTTGKTLIQRLAAAALPTVLERDDQLRSLVYGPNGLIGQTADRELTKLIERAAANDLSAARLSTELERRAASFRRSFRVYANAIGRRRYAQAYSVVDGALRRLRLADRAVRFTILDAPGELALGAARIGERAERALKVRNIGFASPARVFRFSLSGSHSRDFAATSACSTVPKGRACTINLRFKPTARGARSATLRVWTTMAGGPLLVRLSGRGL